MSLLTPDFGLLFWMLLSFLIVFGLLTKFGFPVITRMVNERREYIQQSLAAADEANRRLAEIRIIPCQYAFHASNDMCFHTFCGQIFIPRFERLKNFFMLIERNRCAVDRKSVV